MEDSSLQDIITRLNLTCIELDKGIGIEKKVVNEEPQEFPLRSEEGIRTKSDPDDTLFCCHYIADRCRYTAEECRYPHLDHCEEFATTGKCTNPDCTATLHRSVCRYHEGGRTGCQRGTSCKYLHLPGRAVKQLCLFISVEPCRKGDRCPFSHEVPATYRCKHCNSNEHFCWQCHLKEESFGYRGKRDRKVDKRPWPRRAPERMSGPGHASGRVPGSPGRFRMAYSPKTKWVEA